MLSGQQKMYYKSGIPSSQSGADGRSFKLIHYGVYLLLYKLQNKRFNQNRFVHIQKHQ